jgi:formamidopyrimidine-DNA glycosylase
MPELPEVEAAMDMLRRHARGRTIAGVQLLHPALRRRVRPVQLRALVGGVIARVERRGKHQLLHLEDGRIIHVHFRMNGDWALGPAGGELPRFARAVIAFDDGTSLVLVDSRALGTLDIHPAGAALELGLGPDAANEGWTAEQLGAGLAARRGPIKPALLDQRLVAGLGNIYAAEALWRAKISPMARCDSLSESQVRALRQAIAEVIVRATGSRYTDDDTAELDVYDREGLPCRRCGTPITRVVQAGRSTFFCPHCQSHGGAPAAKTIVGSRKAAQSAMRPAIEKAATKKAATKKAATKKTPAKKRPAKKKPATKQRRATR